jgi:RNA polymerase sigma factor (sigma-70 family)
VWAAPGKDRKTVNAFLDQLGEERCKQLQLVSADMAAWISMPIEERCPSAVLCVDPFHVIQLATVALDVVRREVWNETRQAGNKAHATELQRSRFALWKNPENLTDRQQVKLSVIQHTNRKLYRAYLLKEQLRQIYRLPAHAAIELLDAWLKWARRCRLPAFVKLARTITDQRAGIEAAIRHGLSKRSEIFAALKTLNHTEQQVILLRYWSDKTDAQIAAMLSVPVGTVKIRLHRAREKLTRALVDSTEPQEHLE